MDRYFLVKPAMWLWGLYAAPFYMWFGWFIPVLIYIGFDKTDLGLILALSYPAPFVIMLLMPVWAKWFK